MCAQDKNQTKDPHKEEVKTDDSCVFPQKQHELWEANTPLLVFGSLLLPVLQLLLQGPKLWRPWIPHLKDRWRKTDPPVTHTSSSVCGGKKHSSFKTELIV